MDRISNCNTKKKIAYLVVHLISFKKFFKKKTKINNFVKKNLAYTKKRKKKKEKEKTHIQFQSENSYRSKAHQVTPTKFMCNKKDQNLKI